MQGRERSDRCRVRWHERARQHPSIFTPPDRSEKPAHKFPGPDPFGEHPFASRTMTGPSFRSSLEPPETYDSIVHRLPERSDLSDDAASVFRHTGWASHRRRVYHSFLRLDLGIDRIWNFTECGKHAYVLQSPDDPNTYRISGSTCHDRFCLPCANSRSNTIALNVLDRLQGTSARFITLTMQSSHESLATLLDRLLRSFARIRKRREWRKRVTGGVAFLELKWADRSERWNVHLHVLAQGRYYKQSLLSKLWLKITGNSNIVDVRHPKDLHNVARYVTKYASKPLSPSVINDDHRLDEAVLALKGRRLCTTFASWRGIKLTDSPSEESWDYVDTLSNVIASALAGDTQSKAICDSLGVPVVVEHARSRAPPEPSPSQFVTFIGEQQAFDRNWDRGRHLQWD